MPPTPIGPARDRRGPPRQAPARPALPISEAPDPLPSRGDSARVASGFTHDGARPPMTPPPRRRWPRTLVVLAGLLSAGSPAPVVAGEPAPLDFAREVRPILAKKCFPCHGPDEGHRKASLRLDRREDATAELPDGARAIVPGDPDESELVFRVEADDDSLRMPPKKGGEPLSPAEAQRLRRWVAEG